MNTLPPLHRGPARRLSLAPLIVCVGALALPAAWDLSPSRDASRPALSSLHLGAMPSAGACANHEEKAANPGNRPTPICNPAKARPTLPTISLTSTIQRLFL